MERKKTTTGKPVVPAVSKWVVAVVVFVAGALLFLVVGGSQKPSLDVLPVSEFVKQNYFEARTSDVERVPCATGLMCTYTEAVITVQGLGEKNVVLLTVSGPIGSRFAVCMGGKCAPIEISPLTDGNAFLIFPAEVWDKVEIRDVTGKKVSLYSDVVALLGKKHPGLILPALVVPDDQSSVARPEVLSSAIFPSVLSYDAFVPLYHWLSAVTGEWRLCTVLHSAKDVQECLLFFGAVHPEVPEETFSSLLDENGRAVLEIVRNGGDCESVPDAHFAAVCAGLVNMVSALSSAPG